VQLSDNRTTDDTPAYATRTLRELGAQLPIGIRGQDGALHKAVTCRDWRGREEREVAKLKKTARQKGDFISQLLGYMFTQVGPHDFTVMRPAERQNVLTHMYRADAMYLYLWLRHQCVGADLMLNLTCPHCGFQVPWKGDLDSLEVRTVEAVEPLRWEYVCQTVFDIRGTKVERLTLQPNRWAVFEATARKAVAGGDVGLVSVDLIRDAIYQINGEDLSIVLIDKDLDDMTKRDLESLSHEIDRREVGPDLSVKEACPRCTLQFTTSMDWGYASFFAASSQ
jgi:hypothetical protein